MNANLLDKEMCMTFIRAKNNKVESFINNIESYYGNLSNERSDSLFLVFMKTGFLFIGLFAIFIPMWVGIIVFTLITLMFNIQSIIVMAFITAILVYLLILPQLWYGFLGLCVIISVLLA